MCTVVGQSFILHQIRKMIGLAVHIATGRAPAVALDAALSKQTVPTPMAPGLGLLLDETLYKAYNAKINKCRSRSNDELTDENGISSTFTSECKSDEEKPAETSKGDITPQHEPLELSEMTLAEVKRFKTSVLHKSIIAREIKERPMARFLELSDKKPLQWADILKGSSTRSNSCPTFDQNLQHKDFSRTPSSECSCSVREAIGATVVQTPYNLMLWDASEGRLFKGVKVAMVKANNYADLIAGVADKIGSCKVGFTLARTRGGASLSETSFGDLPQKLHLWLTPTES
eukprot:SAG31_NODE_1797_length_7244_cov_8.328621_2_plen_288_part_00